MRAMRTHAANTPLQMDRIEPPQPGPGEVLLRVRACGVNFADALMVQGKYQDTPPFPFSPGMEVCGVVAGGAGFAPGTRVAAMSGSGGLAEQLCVPSAACVGVPDAMSDEEAACFQVAYGTGHLALAHRARLQPGEKLLVLGASGGVGLTAVELGKVMGAEVIAVASTEEKRALARRKGADSVLPAEPSGLRDAVKALGGADVVYDPVGGELFKQAMRAANFGARLIPVGFASGDIPQIPANILLVKNLDVIGLYWGAYRHYAPEVLGESLRRLFQWRAEGKLALHVSDVLPLEQANAALELLRARKATGKVAVRVAG